MQILSVPCTTPVTSFSLFQATFLQTSLRPRLSPNCKDNPSPRPSSPPPPQTQLGVSPCGPESPTLAQSPDQPAVQGPLPVPVPARAGGRRHPVSQAAPSLLHQPDCRPRPAHPGALTEVKCPSSCLRPTASTDNRSHRGRPTFSSSPASNGSAKKRSTL